MLSLAVCVDVSDLEHATRFYCEALGCELTEQKESHNTLLAGGTKLHLSLKAAGSVATPAEHTRTYDRHWTPVHLDFCVENLDAEVVKVAELGGTVERRKHGDWGAVAFCSDPFGNGFCLIAMKSDSASGS